MSYLKLPTVILPLSQSEFEATLTPLAVEALMREVMVISMGTDTPLKDKLAAALELCAYASAMLMVSPEYEDDTQNNIALARNKEFTKSMDMVVSLLRVDIHKCSFMGYHSGVPTEIIESINDLNRLTERLGRFGSIEIEEVDTCREIYTTATRMLHSGAYRVYMTQQS